MLRRRGRIASGLIALAILLAGFLEAPSASAQGLESITLIGRGSAGSTSDLAFTVLEEAIRRLYPGVAIRRLPGTATAVPPRVNSGEAWIGHGVGSTIIEAWEGSGLFAGREPMRNLRLIGNYLGFLLRPSASPTLVVRADSDIRSWADLAGKRLGVGPPDSLNATATEVALSGVGLSYEKIRQQGGLVVTGDWNQQFEQLGDGQLDAVTVTTDHPSPLLTRFAATNRPRLVSMSEEVIVALLQRYRDFTRNRIPPGTYDWQTEEVLGTKISLAYLVHKDVPEEIVYNICMQLYAPENATIWGEVVPSWKGAEELAPSAASAIMIPLHPGALRCFQDLGYEVNYIAYRADPVD